MNSTLLSSLAMTLPDASVVAEYRPLQKYLVDRYADTVVLTFAEVADLLGFALPEAARFQNDWWADVCADGSVSPQARAWIASRRSASPNLLAQKVTFMSVA